MLQPSDDSLVIAKESSARPRFLPVTVAFGPEDPPFVAWGRSPEIDVRLMESAPEKPSNLGIGSALRRVLRTDFIWRLAVPDSRGFRPELRATGPPDRKCSASGWVERHGRLTAMLFNKHRSRSRKTSELRR